ncbi:TetR/AcrR family transcriptional regulator [Alkaliphilus peptidifermentans]|uniref:Transcriptional regulator, TetR family n=1 Tax=Alkaliphilus peptidifermentans DSM 18978 TaxID=1120976 RepID=A0A1G5G285_9FIRM|nr:TetR/AcrR family transcriptional regulator [Alkaliphilus peptidifermentans]SCY45653.1 transcriptional regulator, TetR family [Alkaliphilus peptidifermentans DSM 18978]
MDGFERRKERKKENICQAAFDLFSVYGVKKVSIAEIAKQAKVSQVTIYNYFGSKDELLRDVITVFMNKSLKEATDIIEANLPFPEKLELFLAEKPEALSALNSDFLKSMMSEDPILRQMAKDFADNKFIPLMMKLFENGREEGYIKHNISNEAILIYINMFREGKRSDAFLDIGVSKHLFKELITLFFYGVLGNPLNNNIN